MSHEFVRPLKIQWSPLRTFESGAVSIELSVAHVGKEGHKAIYSYKFQRKPETEDQRASLYLRIHDLQNVYATLKALEIWAKSENIPLPAVPTA